MAAQGMSSFPRWMLACKSEITQADDWAAVTKELHHAIQQQLTESHVSRYTDLTEPEKRLFLERAAKAVQQGEVFQSFNLTVSSALDHHLNSHAAERLLTTSPVGNKTELVLDEAREGILGLLKRWPENKGNLHRLFNQALPDRLRQITWRMFLRSPKVRSAYLEKVKVDRNSVMSMLDLEIVQTSEALLRREPTFEELTNNTDILHAMKAILSYHHVCKNIKNSLIDTDYMLVIPFLVNVLSTIRPDQLILDSTLALLIEEYMTFMSSRPLYLRESYVEGFQESMEDIAKQLATDLQEYDSPLAQHMERVFSGRFSKYSALVQGIKPLVRPMVRCLFVGYLSLDAVLYVWDQYIIGLDKPDYDVIPSMAASVLILLRKYLLPCQTLTEMENALKTKACKLTRDQLIYEIGCNFYHDLNHRLNSNPDGAPILDPTQVAIPWEYWHKELLPQRANSPPARKARRAERQSGRDKEYKKLEEQEQQRAKGESRTEQDRLQNLLDEERRQRLLSEKRAQDEIQFLKLEIDKLKQKRTTPARNTTPVAASSVSLTQRPADKSPVDNKPISKKLITTSQLDDPMAASAVMQDVLSDLMDNVNGMRHGRGVTGVDPGEPSTSRINNDN